MACGEFGAGGTGAFCFPLLSVWCTRADNAALDAASLPFCEFPGPFIVSCLETTTGLKVLLLLGDPGRNRVLQRDVELLALRVVQNKLVHKWVASLQADGM